MILRNYNNFVNGFSFYADNYNAINKPTLSMILRDIENEVHKYNGLGGMSSSGYHNITSGIFLDLIESLDSIGTGVFLGSGSTPPTLENYNLESMIAYAQGGLTVMSKTVTKAADEDSALLYVYAVKNTGSEPITVSELGLIVHSEFGKDNITFMLARNVIDPEVLEPGQIKSFTVAIGSTQRI